MVRVWITCRGARSRPRTPTNCWSRTSACQSVGQSAFEAYHRQAAQLARFGLVAPLRRDFMPSGR